MHAKYFRANGTNEKRLKTPQKELLEKEKRPTSACPV